MNSLLLSLPRTEATRRQKTAYLIKYVFDVGHTVVTHNCNLVKQSWHTRCIDLDLTHLYWMTQGMQTARPFSILPVEGGGNGPRPQMPVSRLQEKHTRLPPQSEDWSGKGNFKSQLRPSVTRRFYFERFPKNGLTAAIPRHEIQAVCSTKLGLMWEI